MITLKKLSNLKSALADTFNSFFIKKIEDLKEGINKDLIEDPLTKLKEKMKDYKLQFSLKTVSTSKVSKTMKQMKKKKSSVIDGLSQENLI